MSRIDSPDTASDAQWIRPWVRDSSILLASQAMGTLLSSFVAIVIARSLAPTGWGLFSAFLGLATSLSFIIDFGLTPWLLRELSALARSSRGSESDVRERVSRLVSDSLAIYLSIGILASTAVLAIYVGVLGASWETGLLLLALVAYMTLQSMSFGLEAVLRARRELGRVVLALLLEKSSLMILVVFALSFQLDFGGLAVAYIGAGVARLAVNLITVVFTGRAALQIPRAVGILRNLQRSFPFALNRASMQFAPSLDVPLLALFSLVDAGSYALGFRVVSMVLVLPSVAGTALFPLLGGGRTGTRVAVRAAIVLGTVGLVIALGGLAGASRLVPIVFGEEYERSTVVIQLMLLALPLSIAASGLLPGLFAIHGERQVALASLVSSGLGTAAVVGGQALFGAPGAAAGFILRQGALLIALIVLVRDNLLRDARRLPDQFEGGSHPVE